MNKTNPDRQEELAEIILKAYENEDIKDALELFEIQEREYINALLSTENVKIITTNSTNNLGELYGSMDRS
jgi:hypothetical protein